MIEIETCLACGAHQFDELYHATFNGNPDEAVPYFLTDRIASLHGRIVRCRSCGFTFTSPQFSPAAYNQIYGQVTSIGGDGGRSRVRRTRFHRHRTRVESYVEQGRFLDIGAGDGAFLDVMSSGPFTGTGFDVREDIGDNDEKQNNIILAKDAESMVASRDSFGLPFDFVTAWDVLEHLADLESYMTAIREITKPGGYLFATVPNVDSFAARIGRERWNCVLLEHLWYFSPKTFGVFCRRFDIEIVSAKPVGYPADLGTVMARLKQMFPTFSLELPTWLSERSITIPIGLMFVVCKMPG